MLKKIYSDTGTNMDSALNRLKKELAGVRTGRASLTIFDGVMMLTRSQKSPIHIGRFCIIETGVTILGSL